LVFRRSYKSDTSFLEKLCMGAAGTRQIHEDLSAHGHEPIELERGSTGFKIWKEIKIKRVRVPDILCVRCGRRVEARAKTKFEISMSHSQSTPERGWDFGLRDEDLVGIVLCSRTGEEPTSWNALEMVHYMTVRDLRSAFAKGMVTKEKPKGAEEGFELRVTWPSSIATRGGRVSEISSSAIKYRRINDNGTTSLGLVRKGIRLKPLVEVGAEVHAGQVLASVVPVHGYIECGEPVGSEYYIKLLRSVDLSDRYTACKALTILTGPEAIEALVERQSDVNEHIYVRLEAAAGLMRRADARGSDFVKQCLADDYLTNRLEAAIILGEIKNKTSLDLLIRALKDPEQHPEIRAGAAYSLGELGNRDSLEALVEVFLTVDQRIRAEAARSLAKLGQKFPEELAATFPTGLSDQRAGIAWALTRSQALPIRKLMENPLDEDGRQWIAFILGSQKPTAYVEEVEELRKQDPEVYFAVTVLWKILSSWINGLEEY